MSASAGDPFILPGLVHSTVTGVFAPPKVGKSALVAHMVATALSGPETLGREWLVRPSRALFVCSDPDGAAQYERRISELGLLPPEGPNIAFADAPRYADEEGWASLAEAARPDPHTLVVLDHLTDLADGELVDGKSVGWVFRRIEHEFVRRGTPVVVIGHMSDGQQPSWWKNRRPMGNTAISAKCRNLVYLSEAGDRLRVTTRGGDVPDEEALILAWGSRGAADFTLAEQTTRGASQKLRTEGTLERNAAIAAFVVSECRGLPKKAAAKRISERFGGAESTWAKHLQPKGPIGRLILQDGTSPGRID